MSRAVEPGASNGRPVLRKGRWINSLVQLVLENSTNFEWSLQGFGMLRTHPHEGFRINVWDSEFRIPNVSMIHTHPWNFTSVIERGRMINQRFRAVPGNSHSSAVIKPGIGGGMMKPLAAVELVPLETEIYTAGEDYWQAANEIHSSLPEDGTVTINRRARVGEDEATVFWPQGESWVAALPRIATPREIEYITGKARLIWPGGSEWHQ